MPFFNQLDSQLIQKNQNFHISLSLLQIKTSSMKEQTNSTMNFVISEIFQLFYVQFIRNTRRSIGTIILHKRDINGRSSRIGSPCNDSSPFVPPGSPFLFLSSRWWGRSFVCLPHKSHRIRNLPSRLSLIFAHGTRGRKPLIYALPDRSILRSTKVWSLLAKERSWDYFITGRNFENRWENEWNGKCKLEKNLFNLAG